MNRRYVSFVLIALTLLLVLSFSASAHSGGTDSNGGHYDHDTWEYHYHHGYSAHDHYDMDGDGDNDCPYTFRDNTASSRSSSSTNSNETSCTGYHYTYDELIEYKLSHYNDGYDDGYEEGSAVGYARATKELTQKYEQQLLEAAKEYKHQKFLICMLFALVVVPVVVSIICGFIVKANASQNDKLKVDNKKLQNDLTNLTESMFILDLLSKKADVSPSKIAESLFVNFRKSQGISVQDAKQELSDEMRKRTRCK